MTDVSQPCNTHLDIVAFEQPLKKLIECLERQRKIKIVAIGSSSVAGEGVIPFPHRLELALRARYPGRMIDVLNRGIGGQEAPEELSRFQDDVISEGAALVIWQVGTNAIYRNLYEPSVVAGIVATGLSWLKGLGSERELGPDVILMDLQYARALFEDDKGNPAPKKKAKTLDLVDRLAEVAKHADVDLFPRFKLMEQWIKDGTNWDDLIDKTDRLHMTEWSTACVTKTLDLAIARAVGSVPGGQPAV
jgi:acyl-CoA thioesterase I